MGKAGEIIDAVGGIHERGNSRELSEREADVSSSLGHSAALAAPDFLAPPGRVVQAVPILDDEDLTRNEPRPVAAPTAPLLVTLPAAVGSPVTPAPGGTGPITAWRLRWPLAIGAVLAVSALAVFLVATTSVWYLWPSKATDAVEAPAVPDEQSDTTEPRESQTPEPPVRSGRSERHADAPAPDVEPPSRSEAAPAERGREEFRRFGEGGKKREERRREARKKQEEWEREAMKKAEERWRERAKKREERAREGGKRNKGHPSAKWR